MISTLPVIVVDFLYGYQTFVHWFPLVIYPLLKNVGQNLSAINFSSTVISLKSIFPGKVRTQHIIIIIYIRARRVKRKSWRTRSTISCKVLAGAQMFPLPPSGTPRLARVSFLFIIFPYILSHLRLYCIYDIGIVIYLYILYRHVGTQTIVNNNNNNIKPSRFYSRYTYSCIYIYIYCTTFICSL